MQNRLALERLAAVVGIGEGDAAAEELLAFGLGFERMRLVEPAGVDAALAVDEDAVEALAAFAQKRLRRREGLAAVGRAGGEDRADHLLVGPGRIAREQRPVFERDDFRAGVAMRVDHAVADRGDRGRRGKRRAIIRRRRGVNASCRRRRRPTVVRPWRRPGRRSSRSRPSLRRKRGRGDDSLRQASPIEPPARARPYWRWRAANRLSALMEAGGASCAASAATGRQTASRPKAMRFILLSCLPRRTPTP